MLFLHLLLSFILFSSSAATNQKQRQRGASASSQPPKTVSEITPGVIYWMTLTHFGAKCPRCDRVFRPVIPVGQVPLEYTNNIDHGLYFVADLWHDLPLEDKYTEPATSYFGKSDEATFHVTKVHLQDQSINKGWARIAKGEVLKGGQPKGGGKGVRIRFPEKITKLHNSMLQNFKERFSSGSLKLNLAEDGLGQTFEPYFEFGVVYWMKPKLLGSPDASGSEVDHPVIPVGRVNDPKNPGRDLIFVSQLSGHLPLSDEYKATAGAYFESSSLTTPNSKARFNNNWMNIGWAQVALSVSFCYGRHRGDGRDAHLKKDQMDKIRQNMQMNYDKRVKSGSLKLDFNKDDLNQYDPAGFTSLGKGAADFLVALGCVYAMGVGSKKIEHFVVPVGKEEERYLVAELLPRPPPWKIYGKKAAEYFSEEEIVVNGRKIIPKQWWINTSWAVEVPKQSLYRCKGDGRSAKMQGTDQILNSMLTNYHERRQRGESDFSITNKPGNQPQKTIGESSKGAQKD